VLAPAPQEPTAAERDAVSLGRAVDLWLKRDLYRAATLLDAGWQVLPELTERLARIEPFADTDDEPWALKQAYALAPGANFSRAVLESGLPGLAVSQLPASVGWSDWGTPGRIVRSLRGAAVVPPWLPEAERLAGAIA